MGRRTFSVDRANGKLLGVCAGLSNHTGIDVTLIRVGMVIVTLALMPWPLIAYGAVAWFAGRRSRTQATAEVAMPRTSTFEMRESMRDIDRRMAEVETFVTSSNSRLAQEIESLR